MTNPDRSPQQHEQFSFALAELRGASTRLSPKNAIRLKVEKHPPGGFDPYNSTGGFDRNNAWTRVRKR